MSDDAIAKFAAALHELVATLSPLGEMVDGYRADMLRRGYSETAAEAMAMDLHKMLLLKIAAT